METSPASTLSCCSLRRTRELSTHSLTHSLTHSVYLFPAEYLHGDEPRVHVELLQLAAHARVVHSLTHSLTHSLSVPVPS